jgi:epoxyqueuosine reductase
VLEKFYSDEEDPMKSASGKTFAKSPEKFIEDAIVQFTKTNPANRFKEGRGKYWDRPIVAFAAGNNPLFKEYKKIIGKFHLTPQEIFAKTYAKKGKNQDLSVICWILPAAATVRQSNRRETRHPSKLWSHTRNFGEAFNVRLRNHVVSLLKKRGYQAVAPMNAPFFRRVRSPRVGWASVWSERHAAYACGLGTFSLSDGLITTKGKAIRIGSVITNLPLSPSPRPYPNRRANCLYYFNRSCQACAMRCPVGAITAKGHDKDKCRDYLVRVLRPKKAEYGVKITGCGLCQTKVPCEGKIPQLIQKTYLKNQEARR